MSREIMSAPEDDEYRYVWSAAPTLTIGFATIHARAADRLMRVCCDTLTDMGWSQPTKADGDGYMVRARWIGRVPLIGRVGGLLYAGASDISHLSDPRLVELALPAFWQMMADNSTDRTYARKARALSRWMLRFLYRVCATSEFVYAAIQFGDSLLGPDDILGADLMSMSWSFANTAVSRLNYSDADVAELLGLFAGGFVDTRPDFVYFSGDEAFNDQRRGFSLDEAQQLAVANVLVRPYKGSREAGSDR